MVWQRFDEVSALMAGLGGTAEEVAASLARENVKGVRHAVRILNPLVRFLHLRMAVEAVALDVIQPDRVRVTLGQGRYAEVPIPEPVRRFLEAFNAGRHPALESPPEDWSPIQS
jgi:hypothetical protein